MWEETKQQRLNELRKRESAGTLTAEEMRALEDLLYELEQEEWETLSPALDHMRQQQVELQKNVGQVKMQNAVLEAITSRQEDLIKRAKAQLTAARSEHEALRTERERVLVE